MPPHAQPRIKDLVAKTVADAQRLAKAQVELTKAEIAQSGQRIGTGGALGIGALVFIWFAVLFLLVTLALGLAQLGLQPWAAFGIVALLLIALAAVAGLLARHSFQQIAPPAIAMAELEKTKAALAGEPADAKPSVPQA